jgi:coenzyme F420-reducing hydrogenase delta subunit
VTFFICANSGRGGIVPASITRQRPSLPLPEWPFSAHEVIVPCTGKLQPEHFLKAFEAGADLVCVIACEETNCHYLEGSRRMQRRFAYVGGLLDEIGLGGERFLMFTLPGSAREDMACGCGQAQKNRPEREEEIGKKMAAISEEVAVRLKKLGESPLKRK